MAIRIFQRWDWEHDRGERPLPPDGDLPRSHAIAYYDYVDRLYRVVIKNRADIVARDASEDETDVFDYFCDEGGRIIEKRSLDEHGNVVLLVRFSYDESKGLVTETGWNPTQRSAPETVVRPLS
jgi:hypothetical protein